MQNVSFEDPNQDVTADIKRRRRMAEQMMAQAAPKDTQMVSGIAVRQSPLEALARAIQGGMGAYQSNKADQLEAEQQKRRGALLARAMGAYGQDPSKAAQILMSDPTLAEAGLKLGMSGIDAQREAAAKEAQWQRERGVGFGTQVPASSVGQITSVNGMPTPAAGTLAERNNNPLNMRPVGQTSGFQKFATPEEGANAAAQDLAIKIGGQSKAMAAKFGANYQPTLANVISTWAPESENDTQAYIAKVSADTGIHPDQVLTQADIAKIMPSMATVEGGAGGTAPTRQTTTQTAAQKAPAQDSWQPLYSGGDAYTKGLPSGYQWYANPANPLEREARKIRGVDGVSEPQINPETGQIEMVQSSAPRKLSATEQKNFYEQKAKTDSVRNALGVLDQVEEISKGPRFSGFGAGVMAGANRIPVVGGFIDDQTAANTTAMDNLLKELAYSRLQSTFPGAISNSERESLERLQALSSYSLPEQSKIIQEARKVLARQGDISSQMQQGIVTGKVYQGDPLAPVQTRSPAAPQQPSNSGQLQPPQVGEVIDGHVFLGGNPADPASWRAQ